MFRPFPSEGKVIKSSTQVCSYKKLQNDFPFRSKMLQQIVIPASKVNNWTIASQRALRAFCLIRKCLQRGFATELWSSWKITCFAQLPLGFWQLNKALHMRCKQCNEKSYAFLASSKWQTIDIYIYGLSSPLDSLSQSSPGEALLPHPGASNIETSSSKNPEKYWVVLSGSCCW